MGQILLGLSEIEYRELAAEVRVIDDLLAMLRTAETRKSEEIS